MKLMKLTDSEHERYRKSVTKQCQKKDIVLYIGFMFDPILFLQIEQNTPQQIFNHS